MSATEEAYTWTDALVRAFETSDPRAPLEYRTPWGKELWDKMSDKERRMHIFSKQWHRLHLSTLCKYFPQAAKGFSFYPETVEKKTVQKKRTTKEEWVEENIKALRNGEIALPGWFPMYMSDFMCRKFSEVMYDEMVRMGAIVHAEGTISYHPENPDSSNQ